MKTAGVPACVLGSLTIALSACVSTVQDPHAGKVRQPRDGLPQHGAPPTEPLQNSASGAVQRKSWTDSRTPNAIPQFAGLPDNAADPTTMVAHFIDVGQGDATLLEFSCGAVLIDTGGEKTTEVSGREKLVSYLELFFQRRPDLARTLKLVVLSHPHIDHTDGVDGLLEMEPAVTILNVLDNGTSSGNNSGISGQKHLQKYARDTGGGYVGIAESDIPTVAGVTNNVIDPVNCRSGGTGVDPKVTALWGRVDENNTWANNANNDSVVLRVDFGHASFLFVGDLQSEGIAAMLDAYSPDPRIFDVDVLKVGHHGSHNATTAALLAAVTPKIAIAQSGDSTLSHEDHTAWVYGHPNVKAVNLIVDPTKGVSEARTPKVFPVGVSGRPPNSTKDPVFITKRIDRALYDNGWDGNIAITAHEDGTLTIQTEF
jgi:competence protein ComEC